MLKRYRLRLKACGPNCVGDADVGSVWYLYSFARVKTLLVLQPSQAQKQGAAITVYGYGIRRSGVFAKQAFKFAVNVGRNHAFDFLGSKS
jgi:hypothetical protein